VQLTSLFLDNTGRIRIADFSVNARYRFKPICWTAVDSCSQFSVFTVLV